MITQTTLVQNFRNESMQPDLKQAERFLTQLDEGAEEFTFQTFDDREGPVKQKHLSKIFNGSLEKYAPALIDLQKEGAAVFVTINETDLKGRKKENIIRIRALWQEDDGKGSANLPIEPHIVVESSPGKYHRYILTDNSELDEFESAQQVLVDQYGSDPNAKDRSRVLRLPGFYHQKNPDAPHMVRIIEESGALPVPWDEIKRVFPPVEKKSENSPAHIENTTDLTAHIRNIFSAENYNGSLCSISASLASKGAGPRQIAEILTGVMDACPDNNKDTRWHDRRGHIKTYSRSAVKKFRKLKRNEWPNSLPIDVISCAELLSKDFPPRKNLLSPWLPEQGLALLHAYRGVGKTFMSVGIACAVATGSSFLKWKAEKPTGVLFIDGEMPAVVLQQRLALTISSMEVSGEAPFLVITPDLQGDHGMPDIATVEGQARLEPYLTDDIKLIVLDNLSTLCRSTQENKGDSWLPVQEWALRMRARGKSVVLIHHDGKGGQQRGTSRKEDILDSVIQLKHPADYTPDQGACFEVHYRKARGIFGDDVKPFEAKLVDTGGGLLEWTMKSIEESTYMKVVSLLNDGWTQVDIAAELGIVKSTVHKHKTKAVANGDFTPKK